MIARLKIFIEPVIQRIKSASAREQTALGALAAVLCGICLYQVYESISTVFTDQAVKMEKANTDRRVLAFVLEKNFKLELRKKAIEKAYQQVQVIDEPLAQLESLLKSKSAVDRSFSINDAEPKRFGGSYEQHSFTVRFNISDYSQLVELLKELTGGPKPFMLKEIRISKTRGGQRLEVGLEVSSIKRLAA